MKRSPPVTNQTTARYLRAAQIIQRLGMMLAADILFGGITGRIELS